MFDPSKWQSSDFRNSHSIYVNFVTQTQTFSKTNFLKFLAVNLFWIMLLSKIYLSTRFGYFRNDRRSPLCFAIYSYSLYLQNDLRADGASSWGGRRMFTNLTGRAATWQPRRDSAKTSSYTTQVCSDWWFWLQRNTLLFWRRRHR